MRNIDSIVVHHSVTPKDQTLEKSIKSFNASHKARLHPKAGKLGYHIAYHYVIGGNGQVKQTRDESEVGFHASNLKENNESIGICLVGNFDVEKPNPVQLYALRDLIKSIKSRIFIKEVVGHRKFANKSCPGKFMSDKMIEEAFKPTSPIVYTEMTIAEIEQKLGIKNLKIIQ